MKYCSRCNKEKSFIFFNKDRSKKDGLTLWCKECATEYNKMWQNNNKDYMKEYNKVYKKKYYKLNSKKIKEKSLNYYEKNKENLRSKQKIYAQNHKKENNARDKKRRQTDPIYHLRRIFTSKISIALKGNKNNISILKYLPYSVEELKIWLENQFDSKMSWENYGIYWHIDHIFPQSKLPYSSMDDENFKKCWALENLRPLEAVENMRKSNKIIGDK